MEKITPARTIVVTAPAPPVVIPPARMALLNNAVLTRGSHRRSEGTCARELLHMVVTGDHADETPECLTAACAVLPPLNDGPWRDDAHRTETLMPYVRRLINCRRDDEADRRIAFRLADYVCRTIAPEALDAAGLTDEAAKLRALAPITDKEAAEVARDAARAAAWTARAAAGAAGAAGDAVRAAARAAAWTAGDAARAARDAARAAAWTVGDAARAAGDAARAAGDAARAAGAVDGAVHIERHAAAILDIICGEHGA